MTTVTAPVAADSGAVRGMICALRARYRFLDAFPIGASVCGREIYCLRVGTGRERVLYTAAHSAQAWVDSLVLLRFTEELCAALCSDGRFAGMDFARAIAGRSLYLVPQVNPDGVDIVLHGASAAGGYAGAVAAAGGNETGVWQGNACGVSLMEDFDAVTSLETAALITLCRDRRFRHSLALTGAGEQIVWQGGERTPVHARLMAEVMAVSCGVQTTETPAPHGSLTAWFIRESGRPAFSLACGKEPPTVQDSEARYARLRELLAITLLM